VFCPKENNKKSNRLSKYNRVFGCKKFQAPIHKSQTISKFQAPMIQTGFDSSEAFGMWSDRMWLAAYSQINLIHCILMFWLLSIEI
jgi:hypothetical protein